MNLGKEFLKLIDKHFPAGKKRKDKLEKCINRHTIKISYSGTSSMAKIISSHNRKVLNAHRKEETNNRAADNGAAPANTPKTCSCDAGTTCPLNGECLTECIVYKATLTAADGEIKTYTGITQPPFKQRLYKHRADRRDREKLEHATAMSTYFWKKQDQGVDIVDTSWEILRKCQPYEPGGKSCDLCLSEKLLIMRNTDPRSLNQRSELLNTCRHRSAHKLRKAVKV